MGKYPPPPGTTDIPGLDIAGTVESVTENATIWRPGDRVCAILAGGGYAQYCAVPAEQALPIPANWTAVEAATLPENLFTVYDNLITRAQLVSGETALLHGGGSGIGTMATMLCRAVGAIPLVTAGSDEKCQGCLSLGAAHAINYKTQDFVEEVKRLTSGRGADVVLDLLGGCYLDRNLHVLAMEGRLVLLATMGGASATLDIRILIARRGRIMASTMRSRTPQEKGEVAKRLQKEIWPLLPSKTTIRPVIDRTFPLEEAAKAHALLEESMHLGKVVLVVSS
jgi:putative PIG3 family NAD(P)H quinone oxidoreductase